jgi:NitT/TauT family transport system ATP-binding protein
MNERTPQSASIVTDEPDASPVGLGVQIHNVTRTFEGGVTAVDDLSLTIEPGSFVALLGPSGCGKSTLLRLIAGLDKPTSGTVNFTGDMSTRDGQSPIAFVFQDAHLLPWRTVSRNIALPLELMKNPERGAIAYMTARVGLADAADRYPAQLSGGMRMRVSLARALVTQPRLLLLDEPFAALDEITRQNLDDLLLDLWRETGITVIFVTHSTAEAAYLAQRAVVFSARPARIVCDLPIALPADRDRTVRGRGEFAQITAELYDALEKGEHHA